MDFPSSDTFNNWKLQVISYSCIPVKSDENSCALKMRNLLEFVQRCGFRYVRVSFSVVFLQENISLESQQQRWQKTLCDFSVQIVLYVRTSYVIQFLALDELKEES